MIPRHRLALVAALLCAGELGGLAESRPLELKWGELGPIVSGHRVELVLPDSTVVKGEAVLVREEALVIDVNKASGPTTYQKGNASIPRSSVALIRLRRTGGSWGKTIGTVVGVLTGVVVGGYVAATTTDSAGTGIPLFLGVASAGTLGGYYAGKELDKTVTLIKVLP